VEVGGQDLGIDLPTPTLNTGGFEPRSPMEVLDLPAMPTDALPDLSLPDAPPPPPDDPPDNPIDDVVNVVTDAVDDGPPPPPDTEDVTDAFDDGADAAGDALGGIFG
jgi:hypothetical protein